LPNFNQQCDVHDFIEYHLCYDALARVAYLEHYGSSCVYNRKRLEIRDTNFKYNNEIKYVGLHVRKRSVAFEEFILSDSAIPEFYGPEYLFSKSVKDPKSAKVNNAAKINNVPSPILPSTNTIALDCNKGTKCDKYKDSKHLETYRHPFVTPCNMFTNCTQRYTASDHEQKYSHPCGYGIGCKDINDTAHQRKCFHIEKPVCRDGKECSKLKWKHREKYNHPGYRQFLIVCKYGAACKSMGSSEHLKRYKHV